MLNMLAVLFIMQRRNHELAALLEQHSSMNSTLMNQMEDLVRVSSFMYRVFPAVTCYLGE